MISGVLDETRTTSSERPLTTRINHGPGKKVGEPLEGDGAAGMEKPVPRCTMDKARLKAREVVRHQGVALPVYLHMFDAATIKRIAMLVGRYLDRSDDFAAPDIKPCMT